MQIFLYNYVMENLKKTVGQNIADLRKEKKLTQLEIAEMFGYSDKAVSKWEKGDTVPDIETLYKLSKFYGVSLDYFTCEDNTQKDLYRQTKISKSVIISLLVSSIIALSTIIYVWLLLFNDINYWLIFIWAIPATSLLLLLINNKWGKILYNFWILLTLVWSLIVCFYLQFIQFNPWPLFLIGVPLTVCIFLGTKLQNQTKKRK